VFKIYKTRLSSHDGFLFFYIAARIQTSKIRHESENCNPEKGRLSETSLKLLEECGIKISNGSRILKATAKNFPIEILFLRDDDIPQYVEQGVVDIGILGENEVLEKDKNIAIISDWVLLPAIFVWPFLKMKNTAESAISRQKNRYFIS
jgi:ATP phosphoribosyltransferase